MWRLCIFEWRNDATANYEEIYGRGQSGTKMKGFFTTEAQSARRVGDEFLKLTHSV